MQHIGIILEDESGSLLDRSPVNFVDILSTCDKKTMSDQYKWISTIDPYGDTTFNYLQAKQLLFELTVLSSRLDDKNGKKLIDELIEFLKRSDSGIYIKFIGD